MSIVKPSPLLRFALYLDAGVSGLMAVAHVLPTDWLARQTLLPSALLLESGVFMLVYAGTLLWLARRPDLRAGWIQLIVLGNLGWALACAALWFSGLVPRAPLGAAYLLMQALGVVVFAGLQYQGLRGSALRGLDARMHAGI